MARGKRKDRLAEEIKKIVSNAFLLKVRDPRLKMAINITAVDVSPDGRNAKVYYVVFSGSDKDEVAAALKKVEPLIRKEIAENMRVRYVPNIRFAYDTSLEYSRHIESILHDIKDKRSYNDSLIDITKYRLLKVLYFCLMRMLMAMHLDLLWQFALLQGKPG
mgnify:CR=1 FL=1